MMISITLYSFLAFVSFAAVHARTPIDCATNLDCTIVDLQTLNIPQRQELISRIQASYGPSLGASDRWTAILGVMDFFIANDLGSEPYSWVSLADAAIVEGIERGVALALSPAHPSASKGDFGNPSTELWRVYASEIREWDLEIPKERGEHDRAWAAAEFTGTEYGRYVAEVKFGKPITGVERRWVLFTQVWRLLMVLHHGSVVKVTDLIDKILGGDRKGFFDWVTDVRLREPSRTGLETAWELANYDLFDTVSDGIKVLEAYLPYLLDAYRKAAGTTHTVKERVRIELR